MAVDKSYSNSDVTGSDDRSKESAISSRDAMMDYYDDVLGSLADDPLKKLEDDERRKKNITSVPVTSDSYSSLTQDLLSSSDKDVSLPKPKLKAKAVLPQFAEPEVAKVSPLIIPAAFPKLAPPQEELKQEAKTALQTELKNELKESVEQGIDVSVDVESKARTKTELKSRTDVKADVQISTEVKSKTVLKKKTDLKNNTAVKSANKLDRKTALAILEKNKSKLSAIQLARLEAKLGISQKVEKQQQTQVQAKTKQKVSVSTELPKAVQKTQIVSDAKTKPVTKNDIETKIVVEEKKKVVKPALIQEKEPENKAPVAGKPAWAEGRFECLIFTVAGLKLAVPLVSLGAVYKIEKELTPIPGRADFFLGLYRHLDRNVRVLDTAQWVMPDRWDQSVQDDYKFIIRLGGNNWGLACDAVHESIQLTEDQVKWRTERTKRSWLSGTVIGHMCALLDADVLTVMLENKTSQSPELFSS